MRITQGDFLFFLHELLIRLFRYLVLSNYFVKKNNFTENNFTGPFWKHWHTQDALSIFDAADDKKKFSRTIGRTNPLKLLRKSFYKSS